MRVADLKIDDDFKNLLPPLTADEKSGLEKDILAHGVLDPIITWDGFIVDGHNRYDICIRHGITDVDTKALNFITKKSDVMQWIISHQLGKRNLTKSQLVRSYESVERQIAKEAEAKMLSGKKDPTSNLKQGDSTKRNPTTAAQIAEKIGVGENTYRDMKFVVNEGTPEQIERMDKGGKGNGVNTIANEIKAAKMESEPQKICIECGKSKPISMFTKGRNQCKECRNQYKREFNKSRCYIPGSPGRNMDIYNAIKDAKDADRDTSVTFEEFLQEMQYIASSFVDNFLSAMRRNASLFDTKQKKVEVVKIAIEAIKTIRKEEDM